MAEKSDAQATIEHSILNGMVESAHITKLNVESAETLIKDILDSIFYLPMRWAVEKYLKELDSQ